jgi:hypothetical protein
MLRTLTAIPPRTPLRHPFAAATLDVGWNSPQLDAPTAGGAPQLPLEIAPALAKRARKAFSSDAALSAAAWLWTARASSRNIWFWASCWLRASSSVASRRRASRRTVSWGSPACVHKTITRRWSHVWPWEGRGMGSGQSQRYCPHST